MLGKAFDGWRWMLALAAMLAAATCVFPLVLGIPLLDPDEGLHASIAQEMVERGDWIIPRFIGEPFLDKPILFFWAEALSLRLFGMSEAAVRLPGLMFGLLGAVTTALVGWRLLGRTVGLVAGLFYGTMFLPVALTQAATHDVALVPWTNLAILLFWQSDRARGWQSSARYTLALGVLLGLATLTKGLMGIALVGVAYGLYLLVTRKLTLAACYRGAGAVTLGILMASTWYLAVEARSPGYLYYYIVERHLLGFATETQCHGDEPWWFYLPVLLGGGLPWIGYLPATIRQLLGERKQQASSTALAEEEETSSGFDNGAVTLLWCWLLGCTLLLSIAQSKMVTYIWPVFPVVAILAAIAWTRLLEGRLLESARRDLTRTFIFTSVTGPILLPVIMLIIGSKFAIDYSGPVWALAALTALTCWIPPIFWFRARYRATFVSAISCLAFQFVVVMTVVFPPVAESRSAAALATYINQRGRVPSHVMVADERIGSVVFYLRPELRAGLQHGQLESTHLYDVRNGVPVDNPDAIVAVPRTQFHRALRFFRLDNTPFEPIGRFRIYRATSLIPHRTENQLAQPEPKGNTPKTSAGKVRVALDPAAEKPRGG